MTEARDLAPGRATMRDVAAAAGVGVKTVSRVVNAEDGVAAATRRRVMDVVEELGYEPNLEAISLRRGGVRTGVIAALVQDVSNNYSATLLRAIEDAADERGAALLAASLDEQVEREEERVRALLRRRVDGLVLMPASRDHGYLNEERMNGMPIVFADREPHGFEVDSVTVDNTAGARAAVEHMVRRGHRRVALLADLTRIETAERRIRGYELALQAAGVSPAASLVRTDLRSIEEAASAMSELLDSREPPTAVFATRNVTAIGALSVIRDRGLQSSVALVGFDDFPMADLTDPPLTVIEQDIRRIGYQAATRLYERLDGLEGPAERIVVPYRLIERGSGEIHAP
ncbi:MAG: LacI family DNA-binding transcriptional regulator [Ornithinimicrobium sp.]